MRPSYEETDRHYKTIYDNKQKLNEAFKLLRQAGLIARQNFGCCGSCGSYEIATKMEELLDKGKSTVGYVFYNRQNNEALVRQDWGRLADGKLYLSFADGSTSKYPNNHPVSTLTVGKMLVVTLAKVGLAFEWDGTADSCVIVKMAEKTADKVEADSETWGE